jgi:hypothetical protein
MKLSLQRSLVLLLSVVFLYTSCTKSGTKPVAQTTSNDAIAASIGSNLALSLNGAFGGASVKDGVNKSASISNASANLKVQSVPCGFYTDNGLNYSYNVGDTIKATVKGSINYFFTCTNGLSTGYTLLDSLGTTGTAPGYSFAYSVVQDYDVKGLNTNNSRFSLSGKIKSFVDFTYKVSKYSSYVHNTFHLTNLEINGDDNSDITSGTAVYESTGKTGTTSWDLIGNLTFLGNHRAKLQFYSKLYYIDLITGKVTAI